MIGTVTKVVCDRCKSEHACDTGEHANRQYTALQSARAAGWKRFWHGRRMLDYCRQCSASLPTQALEQT